ncbi:MAG TPA: hypothetical protein VL049_12065 [Candidatus Dormibacteraeota bacterium]|nr:hypothetical protein [Candidatus Dormibacteraeota bacterium]
MNDALAAAERAAKDAQQGMWSTAAAAPVAEPTLDPEEVAAALRPPVFKVVTPRVLQSQPGYHPRTGGREAD